jgi:hypothetical protein
MHQSPQKPLARRRDKYPDFDLSDTQTDRWLHRGNQPKARKFTFREEAPRDTRWDKQNMGR